MSMWSFLLKIFISRKVINEVQTIMWICNLSLSIKCGTSVYIPGIRDWYVHTWYMYVHAWFICIHTWYSVQIHTKLCAHVYPWVWSSHRNWIFFVPESLAAAKAACSSYGAAVAKEMRWVGGVATCFCIIQGKKIQPLHSGVTAAHASEAGQTCCPVLQDRHAYARNGHHPCWGPVWSQPHGMVEQETSHFFFLRWGWVSLIFARIVVDRD